MNRQLDTVTLDQAAQDNAGLFLQGRKDLVIDQTFNLAYMDEYDHVMAGIRDQLGQKARSEFDKLVKQRHSKRQRKVFEAELRRRLAVDLRGDHIEGVIGKVQVATRRVGEVAIEVESPESIRYRKRRGLPKSAGRELITRVVPAYWPVFAGEGFERAFGAIDKVIEHLGKSRPIDVIPDGADPLPVGALNTRLSNEVAQLMCNAAVDNLDEGTGAAVIQGRTGAQPADPDTVASGTLLFTLVCSDPAFGNASDANPGAIATASAITGDSSAAATGTVGYCRASSSNNGSTPLDDHFDGEAGTSGADFNFNTDAIVAGAQVDLSSWTVTQPES